MQRLGLAVTGIDLPNRSVWPKQGKELQRLIPLQARGSRASQKGILCSPRGLSPISQRGAVVHAAGRARAPGEWLGPRVLCGCPAARRQSTWDVTRCQGCSGSLLPNLNEKKPEAHERCVAPSVAPRLDEKLGLGDVNAVLFPYWNHLKSQGQGCGQSRGRGFQEPLSQGQAGGGTLPSGNSACELLGCCVHVTSQCWAEWSQRPLSTLDRNYVLGWKRPPLHCRASKFVSLFLEPLAPSYKGCWGRCCAEWRSQCSTQTPRRTQAPSQP